jgi:hypothetical protein
MKITMKNKLRQTIVAGLVVVLLSACGKDDGPDRPNISMNFNTVNTAGNLPSDARGMAANTLEFTSGTITLSQIQFEAETDEGDSVEVNFESDVIIDFATGQSTPDVSNLSFTPGTYVEASVELELRDVDATPSVILNGSYMDANSQAHLVRFEFNSGETFEIEKVGSITFAPGSSAVTEITFDPRVWFAGVTTQMLANVTKNNDGVIVISETSNADIFDIVADGLDLATEIQIQQ